MHMYRVMRLAPVLAAALLVGACNNSDDNVVAPPPTDTTKVDTFSGTLSLNGGTSYPFTLTATGSITAQITTLTPNNTLLVGLGLGTWNGSICQIVLDHPSATQGQVVVGVASAPGD